jgi:hypothetical protein
MVCGRAAEDIEIFNKRVGAPLEYPTSIPIVVRRHNLRDVTNKKKTLRETLGSIRHFYYSLSGEYNEP